MESKKHNRAVFTDEALFAPGSRGEWLQAMALMVALAVVAAMASAYIGFAEYDYLVGLVAGLALVLGGLLLFGPSTPMVALFLIFMITDHQFRSPLILPFGGIEWHPRELVLFAFLAHLGLKLFQAKADLRPHIIHYCMLLYIFYFAFIATRGIFLQPDLHDVIAECRYPIFLSAYFVFIACVQSRRQFRFHLRLVFGLTLLIALASLAFFAYTLLTGNIINSQNAFGEYVPRLLGPFRWQTVRPNGHHFFEVTFVVLASLLFCRETAKLKRLAYLCVMILLSGAIAITAMRTAYLALLLSLGVLVVLCLPKELQGICFFLSMIGLAVGLIGVAFHLHDAVLARLPAADVSLKGRFVEIEGAWSVFKGHPILGAGMGSTFRGMGYVSKTTILSATEAVYQTVHNCWMYFLFKGGLFGMVIVTLGLGGVAAWGYRLIDTVRSAPDRFLVRGLLAAYIGQLFASLAMPRITYPNGAVFLTMVAAAFVLMDRYPAPAKSDGDRRSPKASHQSHPSCD